MMPSDDQYLPFTLRMPTRYGEFEVSHFEFLGDADYDFSHRHGCYEIYYALAGSVSVVFEQTQASVTLSPNQCLIIAPNIIHQVLPAKDQRYFTMGFSSDIKHAVKRGYYDNALFVRLEEAISTENEQHIITDRYRCETIIEQIHLEFIHKAWAYKLVLGNLCSNLLFLILRNLPSELFSGKDMEQYPDDYNLALMINKYIATHYDQAISIDDAAAQFHLSARHVTRLLADYYGQTFNDILNAYRLNLAKELLTTTDSSIENVAFSVGFSSTRSLYNLFMKAEHLSPAEYKKRSAHPSSPS